MSKETKITFCLDESMAAWLQKVAFDLDKSKSDVIRTALLIGVPLIKEMPRLISSMCFEDLKRE